MLSSLRRVSKRACIFPDHWRIAFCSSYITHPAAAYYSTDSMASEEAPVALSAPPKAKQIVQHESKTYTTVKEGLAYILIPPEAKTSQNPSKKTSGDEVPQSVFYNPIQQFNRDLSVLAIKAFGEDFVAKRKVKGEILKERSAGKKNRKRKRKEVIEGEADEEEGGVKLPRTDGGNGVAGADEIVMAEGSAAAAPDAEQRTAVGNGSEMAAKGTANGDSKDGNAVKETNGSGLAEKKTDDQAPEADGQSTGPQTKFRILDALSATGLRALRYAQEIPFATSILANDMDRNATKSIALNIEHNNLTSKISTNVGNAISHMYQIAHPSTQSHGPGFQNEKYDVIDLDPYGTAAPFIDPALQALNDGGMLCVTCTDSGVFASCGYSEKTFSLYGGLPIKGPHSHEGGLRLIIQSVATAAGRQGLAIEPLLSLSIDYYVRIFIRVRKSPADVKFLAGKTMLVYSCDAGCGAWSIQKLGRDTKQTSKKDNVIWKHGIAQAPSADRLCEHCGSKTHIAGPMWGGPLHNAAFVERVLGEVEAADPEVYNTRPRLQGMLDTALDELLVNANPLKPQTSTSTSADLIDPTTPPTDLIPAIPPQTSDPHPFYLFPSTLSGIIHCIAPPEAAFKGAIRHLGYIATRSHCKPGSVKTDAPWSVVWEVMREWARQKRPIREGSLRVGSAGWGILQRARVVEEEEGKGKGVEAGMEGGKGVGEAGWEGKGTPEIVTEKTGEVAAKSGQGQEGKKKVEQGTAGDVSKLKIVFDEVLGKDQPKRQGKRLVRYQQNPRENWGPMSRAKGHA